MSPIFFVFPLLATFFISKFKNDLIIFILVLFSIIPGLIFFQKYFYQDVRVQASSWINQNISTDSQILSESGNVVDLPVNNSTIKIIDFDFYNLDQSFSQKLELNTLVRNSDYIIVPSRRIFKNQNNSTFPYSQEYYQNLFLGSFGFFPIKEFFQNNSLFLNSENAEETWSVFDNPTIRIYKKNEN
jgi:hypothetical protein